MIPWLENLYREIEHGDEEHRKWLRDKLEDFSKRTFREYHCEGHEWEYDKGFDWFTCKHCGRIEHDPPT